MRILHVTLGNPEISQGGLNRYCKEVVEAQKKLGHEVFIIYPSSRVLTKRLQIKKTTDTHFKILNALPVPLTYGIDNPMRYVKKCSDFLYYRQWLEELSFDVIHVHSIQGVHFEFFAAAKELGVKLIFTTHDYYPFCPKCVLYDVNGNLCEGFDATKCALCNQGCGLSEKKQFLMQSELYQKVKNISIVRKIRASLSEDLKRKQNATNSDNKKVATSSIDSFAELNKYYRDILNCFDVIHCNSKLSSEKYKAVVEPEKCKIVPITHEGLYRKTHVRKEKDVFKIGYLGGPSIHNGYQIFEQALDLLEKKHILNWRALFYGGDFNKTLNRESRRQYYGYFSAAEAEVVWDNIDILVAPSQWYETFGFIILEALCRGIPVIASELYGSGYLLKDLDKELIFQHDNPEQLANSFEYFMNDDSYEMLSKDVNQMDLELDMKKHVEKLFDLYKWGN